MSGRGFRGSLGRLGDPEGLLCAQAAEARLAPVGPTGSEGRGPAPEPVWMRGPSRRPRLGVYRRLAPHLLGLPRERRPLRDFGVPLRSDSGAASGRLGPQDAGAPARNPELGVRRSADHARLSSPSGGVTGGAALCLQDNGCRSQGGCFSRRPRQASRLSPFSALGLPCCPLLAQPAPWGQGLQGRGARGIPGGGGPAPAQPSLPEPLVCKERPQPASLAASVSGEQVERWLCAGRLLSVNVGLFFFFLW